MGAMYELDTTEHTRCNQTAAMRTILSLRINWNQLAGVAVDTFRSTVNMICATIDEAGASRSLVVA